MYPVVMSQHKYLALALMVVAATLVVVAPVSAQESTDANETVENETEIPDEPALGHSISAMMSVNSEEVESAFDQYKADRAFERANSSEERAEIANELANESNEEIAEAREEAKEIRAEYENGEMSEAEYRSKQAELNASVEGEVELMNKTASEVEDDPNASAAVDWGLIGQLQENASNMTGEQVSQIARNISDAPGALDNLEDKVNENAEDAMDKVENNTSEREGDDRMERNETEQNQDSNTSTDPDDNRPESDDDRETDSEQTDDSETETEAEEGR